MPRPSTHSRPRGRTALLILAAIGAGLFLRSAWVPQGFVSKYGGDALWALVVFFGWCLLLPTASTRLVAALAVATSAGVEFGQLYHAPWIDAVRATTLGRLVLGTTFAWGDLLAYLVGIAAGVVGETLGRYDSPTPGGDAHGHQREGP